MTAGAGGVLAVLDARTNAYLDELAADIAECGNPSGDIAEEMKAAHARRQAFAFEMSQGTTDRAKKARAVICAKVYGTCVAHGAIRDTFRSLEMQEDERNRLVALGMEATR